MQEITFYMMSMHMYIEVAGCMSEHTCYPTTCIIALFGLVVVRLLSCQGRQCSGCCLQLLLIQSCEYIVLAVVYTSSMYPDHKAVSILHRIW